MKRIYLLIAILICLSGQITNGQIITTIAGDSTAGYNNDGISAITAELNQPTNIALDAAGNVYIADLLNHRVRKITKSTGIISTIAGTGTSGYNGDGIAATSAELTAPYGIALDTFGNIYIGDGAGSRVRKITKSTGLISTIAGTGISGYNGDGIAADTAKLEFPGAIALDDSGNVYIADKLNNRIRKVSITTGLISTIAGTGIGNYNGDGIIAISANLAAPSGIALDANGNIYISDQQSRVRKITLNTGLISTIAGDSTIGYNGDGILATTAELGYPRGLAIDRLGNVYIADGSQRLRKITINNGLIHTIAGTGNAGYNGDGILATVATISPSGVAIDTTGNIYIADAGNSRIRKINNNTGVPTIGFISKEINVFPNPSNSIINFHSSSALIHSKLSITNVLGEVIHQETLSGMDNSIDVSKWSAGVYFYQLLSDKETYRGKFVVQK